MSLQKLLQRRSEICFSSKSRKALHACMTQSRRHSRYFAWFGGSGTCRRTGIYSSGKPANLCLYHARIALLRILSHRILDSDVLYLDVPHDDCFMCQDLFFHLPNFLLRINSTIHTLTGSFVFFWKPRSIYGQCFESSLVQTAGPSTLASLVFGK